MTRRAAALLAAEGVALATVAVVDGLRTRADDQQAALATTVLAVVGGVLLLLLARGVLRRRTWPRTPAVVVQLLCFPVGTDQLRGGAWAAGVPLLLLAGATLWHLTKLEQD
jgi:hypothetical protein